MADPPVEFEITTEGVNALLGALRAEEDGKALRKELAANLRKALKPAAEKAKGGIMAMGSSGPSMSPALRPAIAKRIKPEVKLGGKWTGARVKARKTPNIRQFANAPKRTQSSKGWRTDTFGRDQWRTQHGRTEWFDRAMRGDEAKYKAECMKALEAMAARIAARSR